MKAIKISLLTWAAIVLLYAGPAAAETVNMKGYIKRVYADFTGTILFEVVDVSGKQNKSPEVIPPDNDGACIGLEWVRIHTKSTPAAKSHMLKILLLAETMGVKVGLQLQCEGRGRWPSLTHVYRNK